MEALSRGAASVDFVERAAAALAVLRGNLARLGLTGGFRIHGVSVGGWLRGFARGRKQGSMRAFDVVFLDPPYDAAQEYAATLGLLGEAAAGFLAEGALVIAEHRKKERLKGRYGELGRTRLLAQGDAALSFYAAGSAGAAD